MEVVQEENQSHAFSVEAAQGVQEDQEAQEAHDARDAHDAQKSAREQFEPLQICYDPF